MEAEPAVSKGDWLVPCGKFKNRKLVDLQLTELRAVGRLRTLSEDNTKIVTDFIAEKLESTKKEPPVCSVVKRKTATLSMKTRLKNKLYNVFTWFTAWFGFSRWHITLFVLLAFIMFPSLARIPARIIGYCLKFVIHRLRKAFNCFLDELTRIVWRTFSDMLNSIVSGFEFEEFFAPEPPQLIAHELHHSTPELITRAPAEPMTRAPLQQVHWLDKTLDIVNKLCYTGITAVLGFMISMYSLTLRP